jgi:hypothetical protein
MVGIIPRRAGHRTIRDSPYLQPVGMREICEPPMNKQHGILIRPEMQVVSDVYSAIWNGLEIRKKLLLHDERIVFEDLRSDSIVVEADSIRGESAHGKNAGFQLFGKCYYGNAIIIADEGRDSPRITPQEVAHRIRFFHSSEESNQRSAIPISAKVCATQRI